MKEKGEEGAGSASLSPGLCAVQMGRARRVAVQ